MYIRDRLLDHAPIADHPDLELTTLQSTRESPAYVLE